MRWWTLNLFLGCVCVLVSTMGATGDGVTQPPNLLNETKQHLVVVFYENDSKQISFLCYGIKIQPNFFLATASCFDRFRSSGKLIIKENTIRISSFQRPNGPWVYVVGVLEHPKYTMILNGQGSHRERGHDLAILRVAEKLDDITTSALLPYSKPVYGTSFCNVTVFKNEVNPVNVVDLKVNVVPTKDCVSNDPGADQLTSMFCVQLEVNPNIKEEYISGAPVTCTRYDTRTIFGVFSWGYDSNRKINNLLITSLGNQLKWITDNHHENFPLPGHTITSQGPSTSKDQTSIKPTPDPGRSTSGTEENWIAETTYYYPEYDGNDSAPLSFPLSLPILLFITACVLAY